MTPWHRPDGSIGGAILVSAFITARREAAEALRVSEQRYRTALKGPSITVFEQDLGLRYTWIDNPALGARAQPVIGRTDFDLFDDAADAANLTALKRQVLDSGTGLRQEVQIRHQGSEHIFDLSVEPLRDAEGATIGVSCAAVDITERKRIEAALAESEARYRALATATLEGISIHDGERTVEVNDACWRMFGYTSREEAIGQPPIEVIVPTSRADVLGKVASQHDAPYETVGLRRDGTTFPMQVHGRTVLYQGRPMRVAVVRDLSQQQAAEAALRKSEARYRVLTEAGAHMTWALRPDSVLVFANRSWRDFTGREADEIPLDAMMALAHPEDRARVQAETADALARGAAMEARFRMRRRDGAYRWICGGRSRCATRRGAWWSGSASRSHPRRLRGGGGSAAAEATGRVQPRFHRHGRYDGPGDLSQPGRPADDRPRPRRRYRCAALQRLRRSRLAGAVPRRGHSHRA